MAIWATGLGVALLLVSSLAMKQRVVMRWYWELFPDQVRVRRMKSTMRMKDIHDVAVMIHTSTGRWPESIQDMVDPEAGRPPGAYLEKLPKDLWGNEYVYSVENNAVVIRCLGCDGATGGEGAAADLVWPDPSSNVDGLEGSSDASDAPR